MLRKSSGGESAWTLRGGSEFNQIGTIGTELFNLTLIFSSTVPRIGAQDWFLSSGGIQSNSDLALGQDFSTLVLLTFWDWIILVVGGCPVHCSISSTPGLYPLEASSIPQLVTAKNVSKHHQMSLGEEGQNCPTENHRPRNCTMTFLGPGYYFHSYHSILGFSITCPGLCFITA